jgi:hypothetical protein
MRPFASFGLDDPSRFTHKGTISNFNDLACGVVSFNCSETAGLAPGYNRNADALREEL